MKPQESTSSFSSVVKPRGTCAMPHGPVIHWGQLSSQLFGQLDKGLHLSFLKCSIRAQAGSLEIKQAKVL